MAMKLGFALPHIGPIATRDNIRKAAQEDVSFQPDVDDLTAYLRYMERFRAILEVPVPA